MNTFYTKSVMIKIFLWLATPPALAGPRPFSIEFVSYRDEISLEYFKSAAFALTNYSKQTTFGGCYVFAKDIKDFNVTLTLTLTKNEKNLRTLGNIKANGCTLLGGGNRRSLSLAQVLITAIRKSNPKMPKSCPMPKDREFCYENFSLSSVQFPSVLPAMRVNALLQYIQKNVTFYKGFFGVKVGERT